MYAELSKMKILGVECYGITMPNTIQPREYSKGGGTDGILYANRNSNGNLYVRYLNWNGKQWASNYNWLDNDWNSNNPSAVRATHFISLPAFLRESFVYPELAEGVS